MHPELLAPSLSALSPLAVQVAMGSPGQEGLLFPWCWEEQG